MKKILFGFCLLGLLIQQAYACSPIPPWSMNNWSAVMTLSENRQYLVLNGWRIPRQFVYTEMGI